MSRLPRNSPPRIASILDRRSIRYPFVRLILAATLFGIGLALVSDAVLMLNNQRKDIQRTLTAAAGAAGTAASAAVAFHDAKAAREVLRMFEAYPEITAAALYPNEGQRLAGYGDERRLPRDARNLAPSDPEIMPLASTATLHLPILVDDTPIGTVYLEARLDRYWHTYFTSLATTFVVALSAGILALALAMRLLTRIIQPVRQLAEAANDARLRQDFVPRAIPAEDNEIGDLVRNFNTLLAEIDAGRKSIQTYQNELEHLVENRTEALSQANRELVVANLAAKAATQAKSQFLANMSHDIRTPMNAIIGMTQLAMQTELTPKQRNYMTKVDAAARWLLGIINDILDFSKIEAGKVVLEQVEFCLDDVIGHVGDLLLSQAQGKGLDLQFRIDPDTPRALLGDPLRLGQVLVNLIGNAIKFTATGQITVTVRRATDEKEGARLRFEVNDTGIGLSEEQRGRLFGTFSQADSSTTRKYGGTGLGLSICKHLVEMMGGEIGLDSEPGVGSTFYFDALFGVPARAGETGHAACAERGQGASPEAGRSLRGAHLLVVDDNAVNRELVLEILKTQGISADVASNGAEAVRMVGGGDYDGVLMDCQMPEMDGFEATRRIRANECFRELPIVAMTASTMAGDHEKCVSSGMNGHIAKPIQIDHVFSTLARWIKPRAPGAGAVRDCARQGDDVPRLAGVNTDEALAMLNGNVALYRKILKSFRADQADAALRIRQACAAGDRQTAMQLAHSLRGLAGNVGAEALAGAAREVELALRNMRDDPAAALLDKLEQCLDSLIGEIDRARETSSTGMSPETAAGNIDPAALAPLLCGAAGLLAEDDWEAVKWAEAIGEQLRGSPLRGDFQVFAKLLARYDFEAALESLRRIADRLGIPLTPPRMETPTGMPAKPTILVVDDTPANIELLCEALGPDYRFKVAGNGEQALRIAASASKPDLVLLDIAMPVMSGHEVCQALKDNPATRDIPVIFVTALGGATDEEAGLRLGAVDYITKPISAPIMRARVRNHVNLKIKADLLEARTFLDALTNIPNRRRFDEALEAEWKRARRSGSPLSIVMIDLDHFKAYNDGYGHGTGDICLGTVASALAAEAATRAEDLIARYDGEEFIALLPGTDAKGAGVLAERLRGRIESLRLPHEHSAASRWITVSCGYASATPGPRGSAAELLKEADHMLCQAKATGRNRVLGAAMA